ncbi:MAG: arsenite methyltransferase [Chloroflexota bacterium]
MADGSETREAVRRRYAEAALRVIAPPRAGASCWSGTTCCGDALATSACCGGAADPVTSNLYAADELAVLPPGAALASLGCGNPTALLDLRPGETVLDLGSGGGIDVLLSARRVGPTGTAYGLDMTDEMLALARQNAASAGATNVQFLKGQIEQIPLPDRSVDVVISNCVINLSTDKGRVLREAFRVLRPGGRFAVSDVVVDGPVPEDLRHQVELWVGCLAGALERREYLDLLQAAGFSAVSIEPTRYYATEESGDGRPPAWLAAQPPEEQERLRHAFFSAFVRANKPAG